MAPPSVGSEVPILRTGTITRYNNDNTANVKFSKGPGRPHKVSFDKFVDYSPAEISACEPSSRLPAIDLEVPERKHRLGLWAMAVGGVGAIVAGIFHGIGNRILEGMWPYIEPLLRL